MRKVIRKRIEQQRDGVTIAAGIDAVIAVNTGADATSTRTGAHSSVHVEQRDTTVRDRRSRGENDEQGPQKEAP